MRAVFADASALVKLYADEDDAEIVRALNLFVISELSWVEVPAALWRKHRVGELSLTSAHLLVAEFEADYAAVDTEPPRFLVVRATEHILADAARLTGVHGLRAHDAAQLATAFATRAAHAEAVVVAAFDKTLRLAAATEGFELVPT